MFTGAYNFTMNKKREAYCKINSYIKINLYTKVNLIFK